MGRSMPQPPDGSKNDSPDFRKCHVGVFTVPVCPSNRGLGCCIPPFVVRFIIWVLDYQSGGVGYMFIMIFRYNTIYEDYLPCRKEF